MAMIAKRHGKKWTIPEELKLQREYELLGLSIEMIAIMHKRTVESIVAKLEKENFNRPAERYYFEQLQFPTKTVSKALLYLALACIVMIFSCGHFVEIRYETHL